MPTTRDTMAPAERLARRAFVAALVGLPLWWLLGVAAFVPLALAGCLGWDLLTRRRIAVPPHLGWWLLFLLWVALGAGTLWATAPGTADDASSGRLVVFCYRLAWYVACTIVLVWVSNASPRTLPDRMVHRVLAVVFLVAVAGGMLGLLAPELTVSTLTERLLPQGLRANGFVATLVSAETSDVQTVLGHPEPRPKAPFPFTNTWGSVISLTLVFFLAAARSSPRLRWAVVPLLGLAAVPVVASLNRGLWLALAAAALGLLVLLALRRNVAALVGLVAAVMLAGVALTSTPLGSIVNARLDNPHSNERRSQLAGSTVASMTEGSPVVGYGGTRNVEGTFTSIAGGSTRECPACGVPPLGTQGQLWLVLFSQGWGGALFFLGFYVLSLRRAWRCRTVNQTVATFVLAIFLLQLTVYDTLGMPMLVVMVAIGLVAREGTALRVARPPRRRDVVAIATVGAMGVAVATATATGRADELRSSTVTVELRPAGTQLDVSDVEPTGAADRRDTGATEAATIDTEAAMLRSEQVLTRTGDRTGLPRDVLYDAVRISAPPNTTVLSVTVTLPAAADSPQAARILVEEYLASRRVLLASQRTALREQLDLLLEATDPRDLGWAAARERIQSMLDALEAGPVAVGRVLRVGDPVDATELPWVPATSGLALGLLVGIALRWTRPDGGPR